MNLPHTFVANTLAKAEQVNENFEAVVNEITAQGVELLANIQTVNANVASQIATLRTDFESGIEEVQDNVDDLADTVDAINFLPNYAAGVSFGSGYVCPSDGYVRADLQIGHNISSNVYCNGIGVATAYYTWRGDYSGITRTVIFPVKQGATITFHDLTTAIFYPIQ